MITREEFASLWGVIETHVDHWANGRLAKDDYECLVTDIKDIAEAVLAGKVVGYSIYGTLCIEEKK